MSVLDVLFPPRCAACGALLPDSAPLCETCQATLLDAPEPACPRCAEPVSGPDETCARCRRDPPPFSRVQVAFGFEGAMSEAIPRFKYQDRPFLAGPLVALAWPRLQSALVGLDAIAPIPLHTARLRERGFDQALLLAQELATRAKLTLLPELLVRTRATEHQVGARREARAENLRGAFAVASDGRIPKRLALIDDVVTTTATARDAARALRDAGAEEIRVLALARAL
ncbi:MAG: ComF family protein [Deltaproteobacteria bacterium]|nr:ComF family protein [Deltaproteobacteria bacterium]